MKSPLLPDHDEPVVWSWGLRWQRLAHRINRVCEVLSYLIVGAVLGFWLVVLVLLVTN